MCGILVIDGKFHFEDILIPCVPESKSTYSNNTGRGILSLVRPDKSCSIKIYSGPWVKSLTCFFCFFYHLFIFYSYTFDFNSSSTQGKYEVKSSH